MLHKVHVSLFNSGKLLPLRYMPLELELSLAQATEWLNPDGTTTSMAYNISDVQLLYDSYVFDEAVMESFYKSFRSSKVLSIPTLSVHQFVQSIPGGSTSFSFSAVRAF